MRSYFIVLVFCALAFLPSCAQPGLIAETKAGEFAHKIVENYQKDEGLTHSGYTYRNREKGLRFKIGEISLDLLRESAENRHDWPGRDEYQLFDEEIKDMGRIYGFIFRIEF